jgi:ArsR family transcriptional regulator, arsenate/arsenite/antimonite-responsive transcriptional repressor
MKEPAVLKSLAALSQAHRLRVFRALVVAGKSGATPTNIAGRIKVSPATLSFHLKELLNAGLISQQRSGRNLIYRADFQRMNDVLAYLTENCCQGEICIPTAQGPGRSRAQP